MGEFQNKFRGKIDSQYIDECCILAERLKKETCFKSKDIVCGIIDIINFYKKECKVVSFYYYQYLNIFDVAFFLDLKVSELLILTDIRKRMRRKLVDEL